MKTHLAHALALALLSAGASPGQAALNRVAPPPPLSPYTRTVWRVSDGLPEDTVQSLIQSSQGRLWIGTTGGLAQFDGSRMQLFEAGRAKLSSVNSIFCLTVSRDGDLWAGTEGGGLLRIHGSTVKVYAAPEGLSDGFVRTVFQDSRGHLWAGTDGGLFYKTGNTFQRWNDGHDTQPLAVHSITEDRDHRLWIGGSRLFTIDRSQHEQEYDLPGAYSENRVKRILQTSDGTLWVGTVGGLQRLRNGHFQVVPGIPFTVRTLLQTDDGTLWIGTIGGGLWTLNPSKDAAPTRVSRPSLLPSDTVLALFQDDQKQVWVGTQAGLVRLNQTPVSLVPLPEGGDPDFETISGDTRGNVWVAAQRLYLIRDGVARPVTYLDRLQLPIRNIFRARDGALWIGTDGGGVYRVRDNTTTHFTAPTELTNNFIRSFLETRDGTLWIACDEGLSLIGPRGSRKLAESDGLAYFSTRSLLEDRDASVWIGTDHGLSHWTGSAFTPDAATHALAQEKVWSILQDRTGTLWFGTRDHGLFRFRNGTVQRFTTAEGLPTNSIYQLLQDRHGTFWLTGPNTVATLAETDMEADSPRGSPLSVAVYTMPFGAEGAQLYGGRQPSGYLAPDNTVWFPTNRGAAHITSSIPLPGPGPRAFLETIHEDGRIVDPACSTLAVPARIGRISFSFSAALLRSQQGLHFRYRLENFDKTWNLAVGDREATYTNLPAGRYRFLIQAFDTARPLDVSEIALDLVKQPFFYQTWWFYTLCVLILAGIAWTIYQLRLRQLRTRFAAVLQERSRLAREMHDTVIQGCTGISALLEAVAITPPQDAAIRDELLGLAREQARSTVSEARQVVWDMRHEQEGRVDLIAALRSLAVQNQPEAGPAIGFTSALDRLDIKSSVAHEILMTAREAMLNSLQHSASRSLAVDIRLSGPELALRVTDQGCGFSLTQPGSGVDGHYGILGMRERAVRIGGTLSLTSAPGRGTQVDLHIAVARLNKSVARS